MKISSENDARNRPAMQALVEEMTQNGHDRDSPARSVMGMLGDRWTSLILLVLHDGEMRHADLRRVLEEISFEKAISQRVLTLKLRALERDGFVARTVTQDIPPKVSYRLTTLGHDLAEQAKGMIAWINARSAHIHCAREKYDRDEAERD